MALQVGTRQKIIHFDKSDVLNEIIAAAFIALLSGPAGLGLSYIFRPHSFK